MRISCLNLRIPVPSVRVSALAIGLTVFLNVGKRKRLLVEELTHLHNSH